MTQQISSSATNLPAAGFESQSEPGGRLPTISEYSLGCGFAATLWLWSSTWRVNCEGLEILDEFGRSNERHIFAFWHRHYITLYHLFYNRPVVVVTNESHRGQVIAEICRRSGMRSLQVQRHGTKQMLASFERAADNGLGLAIAVDGPLGPACDVKRASLHLATKLGCPIIPISVAARRKHVFANRWDQLEIPYLFSRVSFVVGSPIRLSSISSRTGFRETAVQLKDSIERGTVLARRLLG